MPGSGAGSNWVNLLILQGVTSPTLYTTPTSGYGTIGYNDSGWWATEGRAFSKFTFSLVQNGTTTLAGGQVTIYGTVDPAAWQTWWNAIQGPRTASNNPTQPWAGGQPLYNGAGAVTLQPQGFTNAAGYSPGLPATSGFPLPGPTEQSGTGGIANPLTVATPLLTSSLPLTAVRAVVTGTFTAGNLSVSVMAIP